MHQKWQGLGLPAELELAWSFASPPPLPPPTRTALQVRRHACQAIWNSCGTDIKQAKVMWRTLQGDRLPHNFKDLYELWGPRATTQRAPRTDAGRFSIADVDAEEFAKRMAQGYVRNKQRLPFRSARDMLNRSKACQQRYADLGEPALKTLQRAMKRVCPKLTKVAFDTKWAFTKENRAERLAFAVKNVNFPKSWERRILAIDEFSWSAGSGGRIKGWTKKGYRPTPLTTHQKRKAAKDRVTLRAVIAVDHTGGVYIQRTTGCSGYTPPKRYQVCFVTHEPSGTTWQAVVTKLENVTPALKQPRLAVRPTEHDKGLFGVLPPLLQCNQQHGRHRGCVLVVHAHHPPAIPPVLFIFFHVTLPLLAVPMHTPLKMLLPVHLNGYAGWQHHKVCSTIVSPQHLSLQCHHLPPEHPGCRTHHEFTHSGPRPFAASASATRPAVGAELGHVLAHHGTSLDTCQVATKLSISPPVGEQQLLRVCAPQRLPCCWLHARCNAQHQRSRPRQECVL